VLILWHRLLGKTSFEDFMSINLSIHMGGFLSDKTNRVILTPKSSQFLPPHMQKEGSQKQIHSSEKCA
jgi:hypothetical protein